MGSIFGSFFRFSTFGESHGPAVGVVIDSVPAGLELTESAIQHDLDRRRPGTSEFVSPRKETDRVEILSGISNGRTLGSPIAMLVRNRDVRSSDYASVSDFFRPGHADYTYFQKYGLPPQPGGGRSSGRETVGRVAAGAVARVILKNVGISIQSCTLRIGTIQADLIDYDYADTNPLRCPDPEKTPDMERVVEAARAEGDSIGGIVQVIADGVPPGLGDPVCSKLDAMLGGAMLSIGAVKGIELGAGFAAAGMCGSESNDRMTSEGFLSNHAGGVLGGISTGQPIVMRLAVKPTPSIGKPQQTIDMHGHDQTITIQGRHDPCICPRIGPVAEAMAACTLADCLLQQTAARGSTR